MADYSDRDPVRQDDVGPEREGDGRGEDLHEAQHPNDIPIAQATNAAIDSMAHLHVGAIYRACSLTTVCRVPNASHIGMAAEARLELAAKLKRNICQSLLF